MKLVDRLEKLETLLHDCAVVHGVPGAALAVQQGDAIYEAATGVVNANTGVEATTDSVFQIGSITKTFTATLLMQLVDEGRVELDAPVWSYLSEFQLADSDATLSITLRQLLTHTSGIDGDFFEDTGRGHDCVERYITAMKALPMLHAPGEMFSYCNAGFVVLGRLLEKMRGACWDDVLRRHLLDPLATEKMGTQPDHAILYRAAVGHMRNPETKEPFVIPMWRLNPSNGPAGATPFATARDLLRFARLHLDGGKAHDGTRVLSEASARAMVERQVEIHESGMADAWGLGFELFDWGTPVFGHDGATVGQAAFLRILPEHDLAVALLTNAAVGSPLYQDVFSEVLDTLAGVTVPPIPQPDPTLAPDLEPFVGTYQRISSRTDVELRDGQLLATTRWLRGAPRALPPQTSVLEPADERSFVARSESAPPMTVRFLEPDAAGKPRYLHAGGRANRRIS
jgi:CubicO group peptidase (beta-lactamase class C family)